MEIGFKAFFIKNILKKMKKGFKLFFNINLLYSK